MTRLRPAFTWLAFLLCLGAVGGALVWMSATMLRLERVEADNKRRAAHAENERLALWRMESTLVPLIVQENARPIYAYRPFYLPGDVFSRWFSKIRKGDIKVPSELITLDSPHILLHFEISRNGEITSPQIPTGNDLDTADQYNYTTLDKVELAENRLKKLRPVLSRKRLLAALRKSRADFQFRPNPIPGGPGSPPDPNVAANGQPNAEFGNDGNLPNAPGAAQQQVGQPQQVAQRNAAEFEKRRQASEQVLNTYQSRPAAKSGNVKPMKALWLDDHLVLARESRVEGRHFVQGCVLNWPEIQTWLAGEARDLLPDAKLVPVREPQSVRSQGMLASIPIRLQTGERPAVALPWLTPTRTALGISWLCFILSGTAVALLLRAALQLSERRGAFVSAVTHELRTPLTTFRLYTEMLNGGMVDEEGSREYLDTLHREAERLGHLVENVLSYARLENHRKRPICEDFDLDAVLARMRDTLNRRAAEAEMTLEFTPVAAPVQCEEGARIQTSRESEFLRTQLRGKETEPDSASPEPLRVRADAAAVERIVFNLVDNACKYARSAEDKRIHVACKPNGSIAEVRVIDHGPGVPADVAQRMFHPFEKSDREAANTAPGVGLGLSLSRRLARSMGGDLTLDRGETNGACFVLSLPLC